MRDRIPLRVKLAIGVFGSSILSPMGIHVVSCSNCYYSCSMGIFCLYFNYLLSTMKTYAEQQLENAKFRLKVSHSAESAIMNTREVDYWSKVVADQSRSSYQPEQSSWPFPTSCKGD